MTKGSWLDRGRTCEPRVVADSIKEVLAAYLDDERARLAPKTFGYYASVIELLEHSLNGYAYESLELSELELWEHASDAGNEEAFCELFGPDKIPGHLGEFLGYFMVRKVMASEELLRASGTVTKKLASWLASHGYITEAQHVEASERGGDAARDLPRAEKLAGLLYEQARTTPKFEPDDVGDDDWIDDYLVIDRVEPGSIWFEGTDPVNVAKAATDLAQPGWSVNVVLVRLGGSWHIVEVGNVYV